MEWQYILMLSLLGFFFLIILGVPLAFAFAIVNIINVYIIWGGPNHFPRLIGSMFTGVASFNLLPIPLFIFIGDLLFKTGLSTMFLETTTKWIGKLNGRLSILTIIGGTITGALTGVSMGSVAMMGRVMMPEMQKANYKDPMMLGPLACTGALAVMIPPSVFGIVFGGLAFISIGKILVGIVVPGLLLASCYLLYVIIRCHFDKTLAPIYDVEPTPWKEKILLTIRDVIPVGFIILCLTGVIFLGIATPAEAAATGALGCLIVALVYRKLTFKVLVDTLKNTVTTSVMIFMIMLGATAFSQTLSFSGATKGMVDFVVGMPLPTTATFVLMLAFIFVLGMFMDAMALLMIVVPVFSPMAKALGIDPIWYAVVTLLVIATGPVTPPFGLDMFALKSVAVEDIAMKRIYKAVVPFIICDIFVIFILIAFPKLVTFLPSFMGQ